MILWPPIPVFAGLTVAWASGLGTGPAEEPLLRVAVRIAEPMVEISAPAGLSLFDAMTGERIGDAPPSVSVRASSEAGSITLESAGTPVVRRAAPIRFEPLEGRPLTVDGVGYRGRLELLAAPDGGVTAVNVVRMEDYLLGVVPLEIGPRTSAEIGAIEAQAVAARTYAMAHLGGHEELGFDLYGTVADQVYGGVNAEREESSAAIRSTKGRVLTHAGLPIRAYYHSTCGGRTAAVDEVMDRAPAPYLQSVSDRAPDGTDWCSISPRYRWTGRWTADELNGAVRDELARMFGTRPSTIGPIEELAVVGHTRSGRVRAVAFRGPGAELLVDRLDIRFALRDGEGRILGSTDFDLESDPAGGFWIRGRGFGHGAGMCQWGAIARARAGQTAEQILSVYYPGATLTRVY